MRRGLLVSVLLTLVVCFGAFGGAVAAGWKPLLGLDLRGGLQVVYCPVKKGSVNQCASKTSSSTLNQVVNIMSARVNALGVAQPNIGLQGNDVVVQLPGVKNPAKVLSIIGTTAQLYFRPVLCYAENYIGPAKSTRPKSKSTKPKSTTSTTTTVAKGSTTTTTAAASTTTAVTSTTTASTSTTTTTVAKGTTTTTAAKGTTTTTTTTVPASKKTSSSSAAAIPACPSGTQPTFNTSGNSNTPVSGGSIVSSYASYPTTSPAQDVALRNSNVILPSGSGYRLVLGPAIADGTVIKSAYSQVTTGGAWQIVFNLTGPGTTIFNDKIAKPYYGKQVANDLDGVVESYPIIDATNFPGSGVISGNFTSTSAGNLALVLSYGALPVTLNQLTNEIVSPTLGSASLHAGLLAGLLGLLLVMAYTIFYYRALGVVVVLGLVSTAALIYGIISALGHSSADLTLDLSGITGLIVSVGITVDSYVVYFERLKDEVRAGRSIRSSVDKGFRSAYRTILSADAVSFIGAAVLWLLSVGDVRGFAFMLGLSTVIDVLTAYFFTRPLVILLGRNRTFTEARGLGVARGLAAPAMEGQP